MKRIPYIYRGICYLFLLLIALPWAAWHYALGDTVRAWYDCRQLQAQSKQTALQETTHSIPLPSGRELLLSGEVLRTLLPEAARLGVKLSDYRPVITLRQDGLEVHTARLTLSGRYTTILRTIRHLEQSVVDCRISSLQFSVTTTPDRRAARLDAALCIEQILQTDTP